MSTCSSIMATNFFIPAGHPSQPGRHRYHGTPQRPHAEEAAAFRGASRGRFWRRLPFSGARHVAPTVPSRPPLVLPGHVTGHVGAGLGSSSLQLLVPGSFPPSRAATQADPSGHLSSSSHFSS